MPYITTCPTCQCRITVTDIKIKSHETYIDCLEALRTEQAYLTTRIMNVMTAEIKKRNKLQEELNKVYAVE